MKIIIPAYEPTNKVITLIEEIKKTSALDIIVIDDGSGKNYKHIFKELEKKNVKVLTHEKNKGKGEAIKTAIRYLIENKENEGCVFADCDGQHTVKDIIKVQETLIKNHKDMVIGVRDFNQKNIPARSKIGNKISRVLFKMMTGIKIVDTQTGLRAYSSKIFNWLLEIDGSRYDYEFNILLKIKEDNISYEEIKIETIYEDKNKQSHFNPIKDSILIYKPVVKFLLSSLLAFIIDFCLLLIFQYTLKNLLLSVIFSRIISSVVNFICNKNYVFERKDDKRVLEMIIKYYVLAIVIMILNYLILNLLYSKLNINIIISKITTEIILYSLSFIFQKRVVFSKKNKK